MSIKIYNGYILKTEDNADLFKKLKKLKKNTFAFYQDIVDECAKTSDTTQAFLRKREYLQELLNDDFNANLIVFWDDVHKHWFGIYFGYSEIRKILENEEWVSDYCYFDNTDQPEGVSVEEWKERRNTWDRVLLNTENGIPAEHGMNIQLRPCYLPLPTKQKSS